MTPAERAGLVVGKTYIVGDTDDRHPVKGTLLRFKYDDESGCPSFEIVDQFGNVLDEHQYESISNLELGKDGTPVVFGSTSNSEAGANYKVEVSDTGTTISTSKRLTFDQVQQIVAILGAN